MVVLPRQARDKIGDAVLKKAIGFSRRGKGLLLLVDGKVVASSPTLDAKIAGEKKSFWSRFFKVQKPSICQDRLGTSIGGKHSFQKDPC
jgi:hypothetical protein